MPDATISAQLCSLPPVTDGNNEIIKRGRIKSPGELVGAHEVLWWADLGSSYQRTAAQQWRDMMPPYSIAAEKLLGVFGRANVNWGLGDQIASEAEAPYGDILDGIDQLFTMPTNWGTPQSKIYNEMVMAEEISRMLRNWPRFTSLWLLNARLFVDEGLSFAMFNDDEDWRWEIQGQQQIKFPRRTTADIEQLDILTAQIEVLPNRLYEYVINKAEAEGEGWNPDATFEAIKTSVAKTIPANDWQEWEKAWKNNDYILGVTNSTVSVVVGWVREIDNTVSHYIARLDGKGEFLYKKEGKFKSMSRLIVPFFYGVGANGDFQSIRGVLAKTFAAGMGLNKLLCRVLDMAIHASTPFLKSPDEDSLTELPMTPLGQYAVLKPGYSFEEMKVPPLAETLIPAMGFLQQIQGARSSSYVMPGQGIGGSGKDKTAYGERVEAERSGKLSTSGMNLFKTSLTLQWKEVARRVCLNEDYSASKPGGEQVQDFIRRCLERGVPIECIRGVDVDRIEANMGIGKGSASERRVVVDSLMNNFYQYDAEGQNLLLNMKTAAYAGVRVASMISPLKPGLRPPQDVEDAQNENFSICSGALLGLPMTIKALPTQNHGIHIQAVLAALNAINQGMEDFQISLDKGIPQMSGLLVHGTEHLQMMDPSDPQKPVFKAELEQFREAVTNGAKHLLAQSQKAEREAMHNQPQGGGQSTEDPNSNPHMNPGGLLVQSAEAGQKLQDQHIETQAKLVSQTKKDARDDALTAAKIAKLTMP